MTDYEQRNHDFSKAMTDVQSSYIEAERRVVDLESENAKLREFAALAWRIMTRNEPMFVWKDMVEDARELGIEVKDD